MNVPTAREFSTRARRVQLALLAVAASALLSACAVDKGAVTQSSEQVASIQGVGASAGHVTVDNALVIFPPRLRYAAGSDVPLSLVITNGAMNDDRLIAAHSPAARAIVVTPAVPGSTPPPLGCVRSPNRPEPLGSPPPTAPTYAAASPTTAATGLAQPVPHGGAVIMTAECPHLQLVGLKRDLILTDTVPLRLTFATAGTVDLVLPVQTSNRPLPREVVPGVDSPTGGTPSPGSSA